MPSIITRGAASAKGFGAFTTIGSKYWLGAYGTTRVSYCQGATMDSSGNLYTVGAIYNATYSNVDLLVCKYGISGALLWQRALSRANGSQVQGYGIHTDGSYVYISGLEDAAFSYYNEMLSAVYDVSGTLIWKQSLYGASYTVGQAASNDASGNLYAIGYSLQSSTGFDMVTAKYNSAGILQWQRLLASSGAAAEYGYSIAVDSSSNVIVGGQGYSGVSAAVLAKYNSSGTIQWQRALYQGTGYYATVIQGVAVDASNNIYATGYWYDTQSVPPYSPIKYRRFTVKYDSSGTLQWQRELSGTGDETGLAISVDSSSNVYTIGSSASSAGTVVIVKYNSSGTLQWQRYISNTGLNINGSHGGIACYGSSYGFTALGSGVLLSGRLPSDGTKTGSYSVGGTTYTYAASSLTDAAGSMTSTTSSFTDSAFGYTSASPSMTAYVPTATYTAVPVT